MLWAGVVSVEIFDVTGDAAADVSPEKSSVGAIPLFTESSGAGDDSTDTVEGAAVNSPLSDTSEETAVSESAGISAGFWSAEQPHSSEAHRIAAIMDLSVFFI